MRCANCGMDHREGENRLCAGPFVSERDFRAMAVKLASAFYLMRNQYKYRMRKLGQEIPDEDLQVIIGAQTDVEREVP